MIVPTAEQSCPAWTLTGSMTSLTGPVASVTWALDTPVVHHSSDSYFFLTSSMCVHTQGGF